MLDTRGSGFCLTPSGREVIRQRGAGCVTRAWRRAISAVTVVTERDAVIAKRQD
jgi:hypothetical protein